MWSVSHILGNGGFCKPSRIGHLWSSGCMDGWKDLHNTNHTAKASQWNIQFFHMVTPTEPPSIMGLEGIHSPEGLCRQCGNLYCPWCAKEGKNEGTVVNHLCTVHYHLGLVCTLFLAYFSTSAGTMRKHGTCCRPCPMVTGKRRRYWRRTMATKVIDTSLGKTNSIKLHPLCQLASHGSGGMNVLSHPIHSGYSYFFQYSYNF